MNNLQEQNELKANDNKILPLQNTETAALAYAAAGLSVLPLELPDKKPTGISSWKHLQQTIAASEEIKSWFTKPNTQVGIICGKVSGNLEGLDFDEKYNIDPEGLFTRFKGIVNTLAPGLIEKLVIEKTVNNGFHPIYRCDVIEGNQKLAQRPPTNVEIETAKKEGRKAGPKTLIETRGEGGYFMCAPSTGYTLIQGSIENIPTITAEERKMLLEAAFTFNEVIEDHEIIDRPINLMNGTKRPGDDFSLREDIREVLKKHKWQRICAGGKGEQWRRPEKTQGSSSASLLKPGPDKPARFHVFSSNAHPFEPKKAYSNFVVFALLEHDGDWKAAAAELAKEGFGSTVITEAEEFLEARYDFRYNIITSRTEYRPKGSVGYAEIKDTELNSLYRLLHRYHINMGIDILASLLHSDYVTSYNPFQNYYEALPTWDGQIDYIGQLAATVKLKDPNDSDVFKTHLTKWLVNAVSCAINDKDTNQNALILVGPQGRYKTTWLNRLVPKDLENYKFVGTINPDNKDTLIHLAECLLINLDELETLRKHELGSLKSVMTLQHIHVRRPYARIAENLIRRASFVGSINRSEFLNDETGTRRFLTHEIESIDLEAPVDIDGVHAQAYHSLKNDFKYFFDTAEIAKVNTHNEQFSIRVTEDELLEKLFRSATKEEIEQFTNATAVMKQHALDNDMSEEDAVTEFDKKKGLCIWKTGTDVAIRANTVHNYPMNKNSAREFGVALKKSGFISKRASRGVLYATVELPEPEEKPQTTSNQASQVAGVSVGD